MIVRIEKIRPNAIIPTRQHDTDAGYDLYACIDDEVSINPGECKMIGTGVKIAPPEGYFGAIFARSGLATKQGLRPANAVGVCDEAYRGEYIVALYNDSKKIQTVRDGDRISQLVFLPYLAAEIEVVDALDDTDRGEGGFGSTGR